MFCEPWSNVLYWVFSSEAPSLLYYSHIPSAIAAVLLGLFVLINSGKSIAARILALIAFIFTAWVVSDLFIWTQTHSGVVMFLWSYWFVVFLSLFILAYYFVYSFIKEEDLSWKSKLLSLASLLPVIILSSTPYTLSEFDVVGCNALENPIMVFYSYGMSLVYIYLIVGLTVKEYRSSANHDKKMKILLSSLGTLLFLISFSISTYVATVFNWLESDPDTFAAEQYGFIGMAVFIAFLTYVIVRYKAFNVKLIATQAITIALAILIGSQLFFIQGLTYKIVNLITFAISLIFGYLLTKSVKREIKLREDLQSANEEQESLIHFISHQVKGFFTKSRNIFDVLAEEKDKLSKDVQPLVDEGLRSDKEGIDMVQSILNAANLKTGKMEYTKTDVELVSMVEKLIGDNKTKAESKGLKINFFHNGINELIVKADAERIKDVLGNIISNSVNYTFEGGINVSLEKKDGKAIYKVKDTGVGLTEDDMRKLFRSGGRGKNSLKYNANSTGYGLYIAKKVIEAHDGTISAESEGRDKGSTFTVELPIK